MYNPHLSTSCNDASFIMRCILNPLPALSEDTLQICDALVHAVALGADLPRDLLLRHLSHHGALGQRQTGHELGAL